MGHNAESALRALPLLSKKFLHDFYSVYVAMCLSIISRKYGDFTDLPYFVESKTIKKLQYIL